MVAIPSRLEITQMALVMSGQSRAQSFPASRSAVGRPNAYRVAGELFWRCVLATQVGQRKLIKKLQL